MSDINIFRIKCNVDSRMINAFKNLSGSFQNGIKVYYFNNAIRSYTICFLDEKNNVSTNIDLIETFSTRDEAIVIPDVHFDNLRRYFGDTIKDSFQEIKIGILKFIRHSHSIDLKCEMIRKASLISKVKFRRTA